MLLEFAIGREIEIHTKDDSGLNPVYHGILEWADEGICFSSTNRKSLMTIPYNQIKDYHLLG